MAFSFHIGTKWCHNFPKLAKESGFHFNTHRSRVHVDWNRIGSIDIDRVIIERDFVTVDENINNVINYNLENEYDLKILDSNFVKVFHLAQLAVEYLLYCKQYLDQSVIILKDELKLKIEDNHKLRKEMNALEEIIKNLKDKNKERSRMIETKIGDSNGEIHKCPHCPKSFISNTFVKAHITRRHSYMIDLSTETSPVHDHYKTETEKLHNEIKMLKERLNRAEKVIRNESDKISNSIKIDNKDKENESESDSIRYNVNKYDLIEKQQIKNNEEINDLKSLLLAEINNLRHRNESPYKVHSNVPEINVKLLVSQQEKEIERLRNQLLEKLTPDIEKMQDKLKTQEDYWRSKIQQMDRQHHLDIEKLTMELKLTQQASEFIKAEYEFKVNALEKQSKDQSSILIEQSKQLSSLSHGLQNSLIHTDVNKYFNTDKKTDNIVTPMVQYSKNTDFLNTKITEYGAGEKINIENADSVLKQRSKIESLLSVPKISQNYHETKDADKSLKSLNVVNVSQLKNENQMNRKPKLLQKHSKNDSIKIHSNSDSIPSILNNNDNNESMESSLESIDSKVSRNNVENNKTSKKNFLDTKAISSATSSYTTTESETEIDSDAISVKKNIVSSNKNEVISSLPESMKTSQKDSFSLGKLKKNILETFHQKLRDLGIDPEWNEIPEASYKQKMKIIRHHQSIYSKKHLKYNEIKHNILKEVLRRISVKSNISHQSKSVKKSPLDILVTNVKSKAMKTFNIPKNSYISPKKVQMDLEDEEYKNLSTRDTFKIPRKSSIVPKENENVDYKENSEINQNEIFSKFVNSQNTTMSVTDLHRNEKNETEETSSNIITFMNGELQKTSTPKRNDSTGLTKMQEAKTQSFIISPKNNKGALKSTTVSVGSSTKKKVFFNLKDRSDKELSSSSQQTELNDSDWNISSMSDEKVQAIQKRKSSSVDNIILKTTQAEKIAEISKKIEKQLSISRKKPVGSIEAMFPSTLILKDNEKEETQDNKNVQYPYLSSVSISNSSLENLSPKLAGNSKVNGTKFPMPTPRNLQKKELNSTESKKTLLITNDANLEADIEDILETE
ncbi:PREDICTED: protein PFC0760c [Polistes canadensis]|uniref:protein PFC0760c n=1 Tax=Polistes canadensis TaxID=91411 RepID=UPI000718C847|nr:PREDICTED: protein PFC0760c [Polistes canadensis]